MGSLRARSLADLVALTRASTATYVNSAGVVATADVDEARVEYDPLTHAARGLLIEEARTNLLLRTSGFATSPWSRTRQNAPATDAILAPNGAVTGDKLIEDATASNTHMILQSVTVGAGTTDWYTFSVWLKAATRTWARFGMVAGSGGALAYVDLTNGVLGTVSNGTNWASTAAVAERYANGWVRVQVTAQKTSVDTTISGRIYTATGNGGDTYSGDGVSGIYAWGAQLEAGQFATSHIPATSVQVARSRDVCVMQRFAEFWQDSPGTLLVEYLLMRATDSTPRYVVAVDSGTGADSQVIYVTGATRTGEANDVDTSPLVSYSAGSWASGVVQRQAWAWDQNSVASAAPGSFNEDVTTERTFPANLTTFRLGCSANAGEELCGYVRKVRFWPRRLPSNDLRALVAS